MKKIIGVILFSVVTSAYANEGEALFDAKCSACHIKVKPTPEMKSTLIAPPISGVIKNIKRAFGEDKVATLSFIREYTLSPDSVQSKCKPKAMKRFGIMPSQKGNASPEQLDLIAIYLYDNFPLSKRMQAE